MQAMYLRCKQSPVLATLQTEQATHTHRSETGEQQLACVGDAGMAGCAHVHATQLMNATTTLFANTSTERGRTCSAYASQSWFQTASKQSHSVNSRRFCAVTRPDPTHACPTMLLRFCFENSSNSNRCQGTRHLCSLRMAHVDRTGCMQGSAVWQMPPCVAVACTLYSVIWSRPCRMVKADCGTMMCV